MSKTADPTTGVLSRVETITPERAEELLGTNKRNRNIRPGVVARYADAMRDGDWKMTGEAVSISDVGNLIQGQHRLRACVEAGVPFETLMVYGLTPSAQDYMDTGVKRAAKDALAMRGEDNASLLAPALNQIALWAQFGHLAANSRNLVSPARAVRLLEEYPETREFVANVSRSKALKTLAPPSGIAAAWMIGDGVDRATATRYFDGIDRGVGLIDGDPRLAVRERLMRERLAANPVQPMVRLNFVYRGMAAYFANESRSKMQLPASSLGSPSAWPAIAGDTLRMSKADA